VRHACALRDARPDDRPVRTKFKFRPAVYRTY
jgi:hypothetical protein